MSLIKNYGLGIVALALYVIGGVGTFGGVGLIGLLGEENLWNLGSAKSLGYLSLFVGVSLSILGVLLMRIFRNHFRVPAKNG